MLETAPAREQIAATVIAAVAEVMRQRDLDPAGIDTEAKLADTLGLKSMDLAQIVLNLEDELAADPFATIPITSIRTVGDLIDAYASTLGAGGAPAPGGFDMAAEMEAARTRASRRR